MERTDDRRPDPLIQDVLYDLLVCQRRAVDNDPRQMGVRSDAESGRVIHEDLYHRLSERSVPVAVDEVALQVRGVLYRLA